MTDTTDNGWLPPDHLRVDAIVTANYYFEWAHEGEGALDDIMARVLIDVDEFVQRDGKPLSKEDVERIFDEVWPSVEAGVEPSWQDHYVSHLAEALHEIHTVPAFRRMLAWVLVGVKYGDPTFPLERDHDADKLFPYLEAFKAAVFQYELDIQEDDDDLGWEDALDCFIEYIEESIPATRIEHAVAAAMVVAHRYVRWAAWGPELPSPLFGLAAITPPEVDF